MPHTFDVRLAGLHWQFSRSPAGLWQIWPWKLDPFRMHGAAEKPCVCVDLCPCGTPADRPETFPPLLRKASGFFTNTVHRLPDGDVLWQMNRTSTEQPVLRMRPTPGGAAFPFCWTRPPAPEPPPLNICLRSHRGCFCSAAGSPFTPLWWNTGAAHSPSAPIPAPARPPMPGCGATAQTPSS